MESDLLQETDEVLELLHKRLSQEPVFKPPKLTSSKFEHQFPMNKFEDLRRGLQSLELELRETENRFDEDFFEV